MKFQSSSQTLRQQGILRPRQESPRNVRVFVSSTFRDMKAEREELVKRVFPQLRSFCERRQVTLSEVDLRWGIPQEEVDAGKALAICLSEVANCRPFFVCLLGERYGQMLSEIPEELLQNEPWLKDHPRKSMTELEVLHGALNSVAAPVHAFFYLLNPAHNGATSYATLPPDERIIERDDAESERKLADLKKRIVNSGFPVREYTLPSQLGNILLDDLRALFEQLYPDAGLLSPLEQEIAAQDAFAENRSEVYVGRQRYFDCLDDHVASRQSPLIVTGRPGSGKSSLLANWARSRSGNQLEIQPAASTADRVRRRFRHLIRAVRTPADASEYHLLAHFIGASAESADWASMLRHLMEVMRNCFNLELEIPPLAQALPAAFANYLQAVSDRVSLVLVLDGIDQLSDSREISKLAWLPAVVPTNVRMILSATDTETVAELRQRRWSVMEIAPLRSAEREVFITRYLARYSKTLSQGLLQSVAAEDRAGNPLYLRMVLEELRLFGQHSDLPGHVEYLLAAESTDELLGKILARLEEDYVSPAAYRPELVRNTLRLIWAARQGLSESELADLLGTANGPLPSAWWSPFYLAVKGLFLDHSGLLSFFHDDVRRAVEKRYLPTDEEKRSAHRELADYFIRSDSPHRRNVELPWQLAATGAWSELFALLAAPEFLTAAWSAHQFDVKSYWASIEMSSPLRMLNAYAPVIAAPAEHKNCLQAVCALLSDAGRVAEALRLSIFLERAARESEDLAELQVSLSLRARLLKKRGHPDEALSLLREQEQICRRLGIQAALAASLGNQGVILRELGQLDAALAIHKLEESLCRSLQDLAGLSASLGNQGVILQESNDRPGALRLLREQEKICRQLGDLAGLQKSLGNQGLILWKAGETQKALKLLKEDEDLCRRLGDRSELQICLGNQALILSALGDYDGALDLYHQKENICREINDDRELARGLLRHAYLVAEKLRQPQFALPLAEEARLVAERSGLVNVSREIEAFILTLR